MVPTARADSSAVKLTGKSEKVLSVPLVAAIEAAAPSGQMLSRTAFAATRRPSAIGAHTARAHERDRARVRSKAIASADIPCSTSPCPYPDASEKPSLAFCPSSTAGSAEEIDGSSRHGRPAARQVGLDAMCRSIPTKALGSPAIDPAAPACTRIQLYTIAGENTDPTTDSTSSGETLDETHVNRPSTRRRTRGDPALNRASIVST